jgi:hypothetical protein
MDKYFISPPTLNIYLCKNMHMNFGSWSTINLGFPRLREMRTSMGSLSRQREELSLPIGGYGIINCVKINFNP